MKYLSKFYYKTSYLNTRLTDRARIEFKLAFIFLCIYLAQARTH